MRIPVTILIADDSDIVRKQITLLAKRACPGCAIHETTTVGATVRALQSIDPDVVVLDLSFPDGTGLSVLEWLNARNGTADRPESRQKQPVTYVFTNHPDEANRVRCAQLGAADFFDKSFDFERLFDVLQIAARSGSSPVHGHEGN
ncbi:MAG: response regulator [Spirochaetaceae bacterium]|nr:MAG: response regulator [Spirochaetaceae bacterium]